GGYWSAHQRERREWGRVTLTPEIADATGRRAGRGTAEDASPVARSARISGGDRVHQRTGIRATQDRHRAAASAARDLRAVDAGPRARAPNERHERVGAIGSESARRVAGMRLVH